MHKTDTGDAIIGIRGKVKPEMKIAFYISFGPPMIRT